MPAGGLITVGAIGAAKVVSGIIKANKAKKEAARLAATRPKYKESPYYKDALKTAESELSTGMSGEAKNAYEQGNDRSLSTSLDAILKGGGSANNVAQVFDASNQGRQRLAMMKDNLRLNQINNVVRAQELNTDQREKAFQFNEWAPWADASKANAGAREGAEAQIWSGVDTIGSAAAGGIAGAAGAGKLNSVLSAPKGANAASTALPNRAPTGATGPGQISGSPFISPNASPIEFNMDNSGLPDISTIE